ncbi:MAG: hypothetical protein MUQ10_09200 [Anaerolineae bacterium]|nr:hypothetical protein [Anaerolineae bacterium]
MMATDGNVTIDEVVKTLCKMRPRYEKANRTQRGQLLDEMEAILDAYAEEHFVAFDMMVGRKMTGLWGCVNATSELAIPLSSLRSTRDGGRIRFALVQLCAGIEVRSSVQKGHHSLIMSH